MKIYSIDTGNFKIDAGPVFGVIPKSMWSKQHQVDENNMCTLSNRCLLIDDGSRKVLIDTGIGNKVTEKQVKHYYLNLDKNVANSIKQLGFSTHEITDVFYTHLHWDHCGGAFNYPENQPSAFIPVFPNATHHFSKAQWDWALNPNKRESAAYPPDYILPFKDVRTNLISEPGFLFPWMDIFIANGHTPGQLIPIISYYSRKLAFTADLIPSASHVSLLWISSYDVFPLTVIEEKEQFLQRSLNENITFFFEHDFDNECCTIKMTEKGYIADKTFTLQDFLQL